MPLWLQIVIGFAPVYTPVLLALGAVFYKDFESKLPAHQLALLNQVASAVVPAVEQMAQDTSGAAKKQQAVADAANLLQQLGVKSVNSTGLSSAIEGAVFAMNTLGAAAPVVSAPVVDSVEASGSNPVNN